MLNFNDTRKLGGNMGGWKRRVLVAGLVAGPLTISGGADAKDPKNFPKFDIAASCSTVADQQACQEAETQARDQLVAIWSGLPAHRRATCRQLGENNGKSYITVLSCASS